LKPRIRSRQCAPDELDRDMRDGGWTVEKIAAAI
jgi:hypothetical protein